MTPSARIQILSEHVANKIAAGEVVDQPASVVKELMENAFDAGARQIDVEVIEGGRKTIVVADDGRGMDRDDVLLSVERHATSKIRDVDDIERVGTLGFRGEALAAISSVSRFSIISRSRDGDSATEVEISGGKIRDVKETGRPPGTTIRVRNIFFNVPARRKFLRTGPTELSHVRQKFLVYALSHPDVGMTLNVDGREVYNLPGDAQLEDRLVEVYNAGFMKSLCPIENRNKGLRISGYVGLPQVSRSDRSDQYLFVNGRPAMAAVLASALNEAYHTLVPKGKYPAVFIYINIDPTLVDVNVHPTKKEVRFRKPSEVRDALIESIRGALAQTPGTPPAATGPIAIPASPPRSIAEPTLRIPDMPVARTFQYPKLPLLPEDEKAAAPPRPASSGVEKPSEIPKKDLPWAWCRILGQAAGLYVVLETEEGLVIMDPHAAHERILYERFMRQLLNHDVKGQGLLTPETVEMPPKDAQVVRKSIDALQQMGFGISEFGGDSFIIDAMPVCLGDVSAARVLPDIAASLEGGGPRGGTERWAEERIAQAACKAAVKANDKLTLDEIERLVIDLATSEMPYTCPHGRPILIYMSFNELDRKFGRT